MKWMAAAVTLEVILLLLLLPDATNAIDTDVCFNAIYEADGGENGDGMIKGSEFITMCQLLSAEGEDTVFLQDVSEYAELPVSLQMTFNLLACSCSNRGGSLECCLHDNAGLDATGVSLEPGNDVAADSAQGQYLLSVCSLTVSALESVLVSLNPPEVPSVAPSSPAQTSSPTVPPTSSIAPSDVPSRSHGTVNIRVLYWVALKAAQQMNGPAPNYVSLLELSMGVLATEVLGEVFPNNTELEEGVLFIVSLGDPPSVVLNQKDVACPQPTEFANYLCQDITHQVFLQVLFTSTDNLDEAKKEISTEYARGLNEAINSGRLQEILSNTLDENNQQQGSIIILAHGNETTNSSPPNHPTPAPPDPRASRRGLAPATIGIIVAVTAVLFAMGILWKTPLLSTLSRPRRMGSGARQRRRYRASNGSSRRRGRRGEDDATAGLTQTDAPSERGSDDGSDTMTEQPVLSPILEDDGSFRHTD